jgi:histidine triad (HIT) family protein
MAIVALMASIFSAIIDGSAPALKVHEDQLVCAFLARDAIRLGHTLVVPKIEVDYFIDVPEPYYTAVFSVAKSLARAIHSVTRCKRVGTVIAGWDVPHFHYHLIPMFDYDDLNPSRARQFPHEEMTQIQQAIIERLNESDRGDELG